MKANPKFGPVGKNFKATPQPKFFNDKKAVTGVEDSQSDQMETPADGDVCYRWVDGMRKRGIYVNGTCVLGAGKFGVSNV